MVFVVMSSNAQSSSRCLLFISQHPLSSITITSRPGTEEEILADFRRVRGLIRDRMYAFAKDIFEGKNINSFKA